MTAFSFLIKKNMHMKLLKRLKKTDRNIQKKNFQKKGKETGKRRKIEIIVIYRIVLQLSLDIKMKNDKIKTSLMIFVLINVEICL